MSIFKKNPPGFLLLGITPLLHMSIFIANAAEPISLRNTSLQNLQQKFSLSLPGQEQKTPIPQCKQQTFLCTPSNTTANSLKFIHQQTDQNNITHVRLQQEYLGFAVFGGYAILHTPGSTKTLTNGNENVKMNGTIYQGLQQELGTPAHDFTANAKIALEKFKALYPNNKITEPTVDPIVFLDQNRKAHWAYKISMLIEQNANPPERPTAILDAKTYQLFLKWNEIKTIRLQVKARGHGGNYKIGKHTYGINLPYLKITRESKTQRCYLDNEDLSVIDMKNKSCCNHSPVRFSCIQHENINNRLDEVFWTGSKNDGYDQVNGAYSPSNDAFFAGQIIKDLYRNWYNQHVLINKDGSPKKLIMRVHFFADFENAFWDGKSMTMSFGDGGFFLYPLTSVGIAAHEVSHGFTQQHSNLIYSEEAGGIDESFSDMAAQAAEYYAFGKNSWKIGAEIIKAGIGFPESLRYFDKPSRDGRSIDSADQFYSGLEMHLSSGVFNRLFYLIATQRGWNVRKAFEIMIKANMDYWTPTSNFQEASCGVIDAAHDLGYSITGIKTAVRKIGLDPAKC